MIIPKAAVSSASGLFSAISGTEPHHRDRIVNADLHLILTRRKLVQRQYDSIGDRLASVPGPTRIRLAAEDRIDLCSAGSAAVDDVHKQIQRPAGADCTPHCNVKERFRSFKVRS